MPGLAIGNLQVVPQVRGHGPCDRADLAAGHFAFRRLIDRVPALRAPTLPMHEPDDTGAGHQDDVLLGVFVAIVIGPKVFAVAAGTDRRCRDLNDLIDVVRLATPPGRMAHGRPPPALPLRLRRRLAIGLELLAVLQLQLGDLRVPLQQGLLQGLDPLLVVLLQVVGLLAEVEGLLVNRHDPGTGHPLQVRTLMAVGAFHALGRFLAACHDNLLRL